MPARSVDVLEDLSESNDPRLSPRWSLFVAALTQPRKLDHLECEFSQTQERRTVMKGTRHSEEQIIAILKQGEAGLLVGLLSLTLNGVFNELDQLFRPLSNTFHQS